MRQLFIAISLLLSTTACAMLAKPFYVIDIVGNTTRLALRCSKAALAKGTLWQIQYRTEAGDAEFWTEGKRIGTEPVSLNYYYIYSDTNPKQLIALRPKEDDTSHYYVTTPAKVVRKNEWSKEFIAFFPSVTAKWPDGSSHTLEAEVEISDRPCDKEIVKEVIIKRP